MKLSVCSWSFPELTLQEVASVARAIGIEGIDVGLFHGAALDKQRILSEPEVVAREVRSLELAIPSYYHLLGADLADRNAANPDTGAENLEDLKAVAAFCAAAEIPTLFLLPGILRPGQRQRDALAIAGQFLSDAAAITSQYGLTLTVEPHVYSIIESPAAALELLAAAPDLRLVLDYSHFVCLGWTQAEIDVLIPHAAHVHLRQARAGRLQERMDYGTINFNLLLSVLAESGYDQWLSIEPLHQDYIDSWHVDVMTEVIKLRDLARRWGV